MSTLKVGGIRGVSASSDAITVANDGTCTANVTNNLSNRNLIINGSQIISQRATSATGKTTTGYHCTDRFRFVDNNIGTFTLAQSTDAPTGFAKSLRLDCTTADTSIAAGDYLSVDHAIEGSNLQQLDYGLSSAKTITISFYVKSTTTGTYTLEIYMNDGDYFNSKTYTISSANTWERKTVTFAGNTSNSIADDNTRGLTCNFWLSNGSNFEGGTFSDGTWHNTTNKRVHSSQVNIASSTDNDWSITGVQLEVGSVATDFEHIMPTDELRRCKRYFQKAGGSHWGATEGSTQFRIQVNLEPEMRSAPTVTVRSGCKFNTRYAGDTTITDPTLASTASQSRNVWTGISSSGLTGGTPVHGRSQQGDTGDFMACDAEL